MGAWQRDNRTSRLDRCTHTSFKNVQITRREHYNIILMIFFFLISLRFRFIIIFFSTYSRFLITLQPVLVDKMLKRKIIHRPLETRFPLCCTIIYIKYIFHTISSHSTRRIRVYLPGYL